MPLRLSSIFCAVIALAALSSTARASAHASGGASTAARLVPPSVLGAEAEGPAESAHESREMGVVGFYYFRLRYLDPEQGRFVSRDPLGIWGDPGQFGNAYSFAGNDPVNRVDPWGLDDYSGWDYFWTGLSYFTPIGWFALAQELRGGKPLPPPPPPDSPFTPVPPERPVSFFPGLAQGFAPEGYGFMEGYPVDASDANDYQELAKAMGFLFNVHVGGMAGGGRLGATDDAAAGGRSGVGGRTVGPTMTRADQIAAVEARLANARQAMRTAQTSDELAVATAEANAAARELERLRPFQPRVSPADPCLQGMAKKRPKPGATGKAGATDIPTWARGEVPNVGESGEAFASRLLDAKYGAGKWRRGAGTEFSKLKKYADRHFEDPQ